MQIVSAHQAISPSAHQATNMLLLQEEGHLISSCFQKWRVAQKQHSVEPKPNGFISKPLPLYDVSEDTPPQDPRKTIRVQCHCQVSNSMPIKILRDSGASQSLLLSDTLVLSEKLSTGVSVLFHI